ncbi:hypothetical protein [Rhodopseudomonas palustris]|uniref:hypothetical protein n=1 Tax=Rhodopseudomonas palustris TaxID=1076 RepID=UPI000CEBE551|nr:hypothetical protein [Rhodopseudomonas palustris]PPQ42150.1 hypothetical protein CKO39_18340 [Rhodopseudomonas palustris]
MPISTAPDQTKLLVIYRPYKHPWVTTAVYYPEKTLEAYADFADEDGFVPAGWYESGCESETDWCLSNTPTHWRWRPGIPSRIKRRALTAEQPK